MVRAAVVDPDDQRLAVPDIGDAGVARDRQGRMGSGQRGHVEDFAIGGQPAVEIVAIPGSHSLGAIVRILFRHVDPACDGVGLADAVGSPALRHGLPERHHARARGDAIFGIDAAGEFAGRGAVGEEKARCHGNSATRRQDDRFWPSNPHRPNYHFQRPTAYVEALRPYLTMRPTSASRREDIATGTRRKWGQLPRGE